MENCTVNGSLVSIAEYSQYEVFNVNSEVQNLSIRFTVIYEMNTLVDDIQTTVY